jgi:Fic family protein
LNNLLGTFEYCPIIRRTRTLRELMEVAIRKKVSELKKDYSPEVFQRAITYLYKKETRSSYEIEREAPSPDRMERFTTLLAHAGKEPTERLVARQRLLMLQNTIVDPRFAVDTFRSFQNYVGASLPNDQELIHYICPPPSMARELMHGLWELSIKSSPVPAEIRAGLISFGFVFIHPFEDGNGRIHRFLIHDVLAQDAIVPEGMIIPVSAHILNNIREYDTTLEKYSRPLMQRIRYRRMEDAMIEITNEQDVEGYFRYPDLTEQCIYLLQTIQATLVEDMPRELQFIQRYDEAKRELQGIVDMPDKDINLMLTFFHQNNGVFPKRRRERFHRLTDEEIERMQTVYRRIYGMD